MAVVHNPMAVNPIPKHFLPAHAEYIAIDQGNSYQLDRHDGLLSCVQQATVAENQS
jgi:hypothetical protein